MRKRVNEPARHNTENEDETIAHINIGSRVSSHELWDQCEPGVPVLRAGWPEEVTIFLDKFCRANDAEVVEVFAASRKKKKKAEILLEPAQYVATEQSIMSLRPEKNNLLFSPVPIAPGRRTNAVRMGWATVSKTNPLMLFPEPAIYWSIGKNACQMLIPWHEQKTIEESCADIEAMAEELNGAEISSTPDDILFLPGSLIFHPKTAPRTASVLYDAFTATAFENFNDHRFDY